jgi:hypothetical protein
MKRLQSALEFMTTCGWTILILAIVLATLYAIGVFNLASSAPSACNFPSNVGCLGAYLYPTGTLSINLQQAAPDTINVLSLGCNDQGAPVNMIAISPPTVLLVGANGGTGYIDWVRVRTYPPSGTMPTTSFGAIIWAGTQTR